MFFRGFGSSSYLYKSIFHHAAEAGGSHDRTRRIVWCETENSLASFFIPQPSSLLLRISAAEVGVRFVLLPQAPPFFLRELAIPDFTRCDRLKSSILDIAAIIVATTSPIALSVIIPSLTQHRWTFQTLSSSKRPSKRAGVPANLDSSSATTKWNFR